MSRPLTIGRAPDNDVVLSDIHISRNHSRLSMGPKGILIEDLNSGNGTFVNGQKVKTAIVTLGDIIVFGGITRLNWNDPHVAAWLSGTPIDIGSITGEFSNDSYTIGRASDNNIILENSVVSRYHAKLIKSPMGLIIEDLGSENGTQISGRAIQRQQVRIEDKVVFGGEVHLDWSDAGLNAWLTEDIPMPFPVDHEPGKTNQIPEWVLSRKTISIAAALLVLVLVVTGVFFITGGAHGDILLASGVIGSRGGSISLADGTLFEVPPGALTEDTEISLERLEGTESLTELGFDITYLEPTGLSFREPAMLRIPTIDVEQDQEIAIYTSGDGSSWEHVPVMYTNQGFINCEVEHFSSIIQFVVEPAYLVMDIPGQYLQPGDLVYKMSGAGVGSIVFPGHVGIYAGTDNWQGIDSLENDGSTVIHSDVGCGVERTSLGSRFMRDQGLYLGARRYAGSVSDSDRNQVLSYAFSKIGSKYDVLRGGKLTGADTVPIHETVSDDQTGNQLNYNDEKFSCVGLTEAAYDHAGLSIIPGWIDEGIGLPDIPIIQFARTEPVDQINVFPGSSVIIPVRGVVRSVDAARDDLYWDETSKSSISASGLPDGASFSGNTFSWTPPKEMAGETVVVEFTMTTNFYSGSINQSLTMHVQEDPLIESIDTGGRFDASGLPDEAITYVYAVTQDDVPLGFSGTNITVQESSDGVNWTDVSNYDVSSTSSSGVPINIAFAMDYSGSMGSGDIDDMENAVVSFLRMMTQDEMGLVIKFSDSFDAQGLSADKHSLENYVMSHWSGKGGGTALYDAILAAVQTENLFAVLALTDGVDRDSRNYSAGEESSFIRALQQYGVPVFTIGLSSQCDYGVLQAIADGTGGFYYHSPSSSELEDIYFNIGGVFDESYTISWQPSSGLGYSGYARITLEFEGTYETVTDQVEFQYNAPVY